MTQVRVEWFQVRLTAQMSEQILAHGYQRCGAARHHVHAAQQLLAGRLGRLGELGGALGRGLREVGLRGRPELVLCRQKVLNEKAINRDPICGPDLAQCRMQLPRDRRTRRLAAFGEKSAGERASSVKWCLGSLWVKYLGVGAPAVSDRGPEPFDPGTRFGHRGRIGEKIYAERPISSQCLLIAGSLKRRFADRELSPSSRQDCRMLIS